MSRKVGAKHVQHVPKSSADMHAPISKLPEDSTVRGQDPRNAFLGIDRLQ